MHLSSYYAMQVFKEQYLSDRIGSPLTVCDYGSYDVNGSYRPIFEEPGWKYFGIDMAAGKNVDVVLKNPYRWSGVGTASVDVVVSGQAFEHTEYFWVTILEIYRILKPGGLCCIIAPATGPEHRYPVDCWRIYQDGMRAIAVFGGLEVIVAQTHWEKPGIPDGSDDFLNSILVARKNDMGFLRNLRRDALRRLQHRVLSLRLKSASPE